jgi:hypothetical protein
MAFILSIFKSSDSTDSSALAYSPASNFIAAMLNRDQSTSIFNPEKWNDDSLVVDFLHEFATHLSGNLHLCKEDYYDKAK